MSLPHRQLHLQRRAALQTKLHDAASAMLTESCAMDAARVHLQSAQQRWDQVCGWARVCVGGGENG
jgi:hypothetical protein